MGQFSMIIMPPTGSVLSDIQHSEAKGAYFFYGHVERIYGLFSVLTAPQIGQLEQWYRGNNDLDKVCENNPTAQVARYTDISDANQDLCDELAPFFKGLYSQSLLSLAPLKAKIGDIDDHYKAFVAVNKVVKCPFCGISDLLGEHHSPRDAYDHYLPKALYPFNSINFKNLVPACHHCNSSYKTSKDPAYVPKDPTMAAKRRTAFYPYNATKSYSINLQVVLLHSDIANLTPVDIDLNFGPAALSEKIDTWKDVYGIEERFKAKLCSEGDGKYWLLQVLDEWDNDGRRPADYMVTLERQTQDKPFYNCNFLKKSFLDACQNLGVF